MKIFNLLFITFLFTISTSAAIRYVSKTGSSTPPFTSWETASDSIQKCINVCVDGDTVIIGNGIYRECFYVIKELTIFGMSMDSTIVDATNLVPGPPPMKPNCSFLFRKKSKIENISLIGKGIIPGFFTVCIEDCNVTVRNCSVKSGLSAFQLIGYFTDDILIDRCLISETMTGVQGGGLTVLFAYVVKDCIIITVNGIGGGEGILNNYSLFKSQGNIIIGKELGKSAIHSEGNTHSDILNNFAAGYEHILFLLGQYPGEVSNFVNNVITYFKPMSISTSRCILLSDGNLWNVRNNIIMNSIGNRPAIFCPTDTLKTDYNIFWKNGLNGNDRVKFGEYDLFVDPMLINDTVAVVNGNYDYHLQAYSPAIDAGDPTILDPDGTRSDIGLYGGPFGQTYQYQDLPPRRPMGIVPTLNPKERKIVVKWDRNSEADTSHYIVYKDTVSNFPTDSSHIFLTQKDTVFEDNYNLGTSRLYYRIRAVDKQGNISEASDEVSFILTDAGDYKTKVKMAYHLYQNYPNPFNPVTKISYQLPEGGYVKIMVYDIKGELLEVIVNENKPIGYYEVEFNGGRYSSGIYLYRIEVIDERGIPRFIDMKKMMLVK